MTKQTNKLLVNFLLSLPFQGNLFNSLPLTSRKTIFYFTG